MKALYGRVLETVDDEAHGGLAQRDAEAVAPRMESQLTEQDRVIRSTALPGPALREADPLHRARALHEGLRPGAVP
jgi:hypothetical protein